jgi:isopentenyl-diphosphate delta-isomerase
MTEVVLVNEKDEPIGQEEKMKAHLEAKLHRAFSILVFNKAGEWL